MSQELEFTDTDLTNIARGFDAPAEPSLLKKLKQQARDREEEMEHEKNEQSSLHQFLQDNEKDRDERER